MARTSSVVSAAKYCGPSKESINEGETISAPINGAAIGDVNHNGQQNLPEVLLQMMPASSLE